MGFKEIFSSFKALTTMKRRNKPKNSKSHQHISDNSDLNKTLYLLETHSQHINKIIMTNETKIPTSISTNPISIQISPSYDQIDYGHNGCTSTSIKRCKIRTNPWIRSTSFHSTLNETNTNTKNSNSSTSGISSSSSTSTKTSHKIFNTKIDDYSLKCEQTLDHIDDTKYLNELTNIFDNVLLNDDFRVISDYDDNDDDDVELEHCVNELYKQIDCLKEKKKLLENTPSLVNSSTSIIKQIRV